MVLVEPGDLNQNNTYWMALPSLRRDAEAVTATEPRFTTMIDQRTLTDQAHPTAYRMKTQPAIK